MRGFESEIPGSGGYVYDVRDVGAASQVLGEIRAAHGLPSVVIYNTNSGAFVDIDQDTVEDLQSAWEINTSMRPGSLMRPTPSPRSPNTFELDLRPYGESW